MTRERTGRACLVALALLLVLVPGGTASAHKFYASLAQVERTPDGRVEVALRLFPDDLEEALRRTTGKRVVVEDSKAFAAAVMPWINAHFALESGRRATAFTYVGVEVTVQVAWVYIEATWPVALDASAMRNDILVDLFPDQVNTVNFVEGTQRSSQVFSATRRRAERVMDAQR